MFITLSVPGGHLRCVVKILHMCLKLQCVELSGPPYKWLIAGNRKTV